MKRMLVTLAVAAGLVAGSPAVSASAAPARAHSGPPAIAAIYLHDVVQRATPYASCWSYGSGGSGGTVCIDGTTTFQKAATVHAPARVAIRVRSADRPRHWSVVASSRVRHHAGFDTMVGGKQLPFQLMPHRVRGEITAWDVIVRLDKPDRDYYLETGGDFGAGRDAFYRLHLHT